MTASDDFGRRFGQFLEEGPARSPERPVESAIAHARAHPRRRDALALLRRDPMGRRSSWSARPVLVLAVLGLLLALSAAVFVGSQPRQPSVVPPAPTTPSPSASPAPSPSPLPSPSPSPAAPRSVQVTDGNGVIATVEIVDESGLLTDAAGFPPEPERFQNDEIEAVQLPADEGAGDRAIILMWVELSCPGPHRLTIDSTARHFVLEPVSCPVDSIGVDHQLVLTFSEPVPATEIDTEIVRR